jgi:DUF438 domain-containing protein
MIELMNDEVVKAILETLPVEISVIDANDEVIGWNQHEGRLFKRPLTSMGSNFRDCHPQSSLDKVERIVSEMKEGTRKTARFWIDLNVKDAEKPHKILIQFFALHNPEGKYLGCLECVQDVEDIMHLEGQKRLID